SDAGERWVQLIEGRGAPRAGRRIGMPVAEHQRGKAASGTKRPDFVGLARDEPATVHGASVSLHRRATKACRARVAIDERTRVQFDRAGACLIDAIANLTLAGRLVTTYQVRRCCQPQRATLDAHCWMREPRGRRV